MLSPRYVLGNDSRMLGVIKHGLTIHCTVGGPQPMWPLRYRLGFSFADPPYRYREAIKREKNRDSNTAVEHYSQRCIADIRRILEISFFLFSFFFFLSHIYPYTLRSTRQIWNLALSTGFAKKDLKCEKFARKKQSAGFLGAQTRAL